VSLLAERVTAPGRPLLASGDRSAPVLHYPANVDDPAAARTGLKPDKQQQILDAVLALLAQHGISGVSIRAVARTAGVSLGLVSYYYEDKTTLVAAALRRIEAQDLELVAPDPELSPTEGLQTALRRVADPEFLTTEYLSLRLQLWSLAQAHPEFAAINAAAHRRYRSRLASLIRAALPELSRDEAARRACDIDIIQNGMWLTSLLGVDRASIRRSVDRCASIALEPRPGLPVRAADGR
jgi:AcrR family transcriptional regulator